MRVKTWLMRIAVNLIRDRIRTELQSAARNARAGINLANGWTVASNRPKRPCCAETGGHVMGCRRPVPEKQRCVFLLRFVETWTFWKS